MRKLQFVFMTLAVLCFAVPVFADAGTAAVSLIPIGAGIAMGLAAGMCGMGQGRAVASAAEAVARNPGTRPAIMLFLVLGLAFIESLTLFTMVIVFVKM
ncbi:MAG: ATP synthase F0 subunit C [Terracidiphilus sp.]|jgi:F-type H+-transporting ATPase subunit c